MGISCSVFVKEDSNIKATDLYEMLERICSAEGLFIDINMEEVDTTNKTKIIRTNISDLPLDEDSRRQLCVDIFDEPYKYKYNSFEWFDESINFFEMITIDFFEKNEDLLFKIVYGLLKQYPNTKLWTEEEWFYNLEDLKNIDKSIFDLKWCYNNPGGFS